MPPVYQIPPWLHPPDTVGPFVQAQRLRAEMEMQQQRLAQQTQMAAMEAQIKREQSERESMLSQQRIEVAKAQQQQEAALKMQELEQAKQKIQMQAEQAARRSQALGQYQEAVRSGADPLKAILEYGPAMGQQASAESAAIRASQMMQRQKNFEPVWRTSPTGTSYLYNPGSGAVHFDRSVKEGLTDKQNIDQLIRLRHDTASKVDTNPLHIGMMDEDQKKYQRELMKQVKDYDDQIKDLRQKAMERMSKRQVPDGMVAVTKNGVQGYIPAEHADRARGLPDVYSFGEENKPIEEQDQEDAEQQPQ